MPLYEYECDACGRRFERIQRFSDPPVAACPTCNGSVRKLLSTPAIQFKGSGFYITDYARSGKAGADGEGKADKGSQQGTGGTSEKTTDKPEAASGKDVKDGSATSSSAPASSSETAKPPNSAAPKE